MNGRKKICIYIYVFVVVQSLSRVRLFATPWTEAPRACLSLTISRSLPKFMSITSVLPSNYLILWCPLLLLPLIFPNIRDFSSDSAVHIIWPIYWSFSISPSNQYSGLICIKIYWFDLAVQRTLRSLLQHHSWRHQFFGSQPSLPSGSHNHMWPLGRP